ncbi:MAG: tRNA uridine-5-carboxymethylaminomethyl(34) synthesis GTPase MnmE [Alphaproteobacteria bacterium]|nr:tRNA uridine-5-carboxymethylaminomethyl(34) synthesis GTPase MnmE [Alphaproteobacteria bacterium]
MDNKTIYALSTVYGKSGVAVIRISGSSALAAVKAMTNLDIAKIKPRYAYFVSLKNTKTGNTLDKCLILYFKAPNSFTGEDIVEIQTHGSKAVISGVLSCLSEMEGFRMAEPGEFSKRAFYNGKMDLTEAEGLADLIDAETSEQQKYAMRQMEGGLKNLYDDWREQLLKILAHLEAFIDFPEEEIPGSVISDMKNNVFKLENSVYNHLKGDNIGERLREGFRVVIVGPPNAGKSSLLNAIANREAVIVSDIAGTTRDAVDIHLDIKGYPVMFTDTAGLREANEEIEKKGIEIAYSKIKSADFIICLFDASKDGVQIFDNIRNSFKNNTLLVANKSDKLTSEQCSNLQKQGCILISAKQKAGISQILDRIYDFICERFTSNSNLLITCSRYREALQDVMENLQNFGFDKEIELTAEDIRLAARALGRITGRIEVDDVLDKIFGDFCIGK